MTAILLLAGGRGSAGHSVGHYPSYYPDEIRIDVLDPTAAAKGLADVSLHAYVGATPRFEGPLPAGVRSVRSLGAFLVLTFDTGSSRFATAAARCAAARPVLAALSEDKTPGFVFHPYPVTPFHADYLEHLDRIEAARKAAAGAGAAAATVKVGAKGSLAETIVRARWGSADGSDVRLEVVTLETLLATATQYAGWPGPPWVKDGWFHAHLLLAPGLDDAARRAAEQAYQRLIRGETRSLAERADLERELVSTLTGECRRLVAGYVLREEFLSESYPAGVENVAYDSIVGLNAPILARTAKLKEYPWNGKLHLGVQDRSTAAWNPVCGFTDDMGRLLWSAVGDPAMISFPFNASWMPNRVQAEVSRVLGQSGGMKAPADALRPVRGTGLLERVGALGFASAKVTYDVLASPFEDGSEMTVADLVYAYALPYRWGAAGGGGRPAPEPCLAGVLGALEDRLVGFKVVRVDETQHAIAEGMTITTKTPVLEVYLRNAPGDERQLAALAPPWSSAPWHLLVLMEEAVSRGLATFSREESVRRRLPWLDLVRDKALAARLQDMLAQFEREGYRPQPLRDFVSADEARTRWRLLRAFAQKTGHVLVANGPYRLKAWQPDGVVLEAVREMTYPLGFGTFDRFVHPPRAAIKSATRKGAEIIVDAEAEMVLKMGRGYGLVSEPLRRTTLRGTYGLLVVSRYVLVGPSGKVLKVDKMDWRDDGQFIVKLPDGLPPGQYTLILGVLLDGNAVEPQAKVLDVRIGAGGSPG